MPSRVVQEAKVQEKIKISVIQDKNEIEEQSPPSELEDSSDD